MYARIYLGYEAGVQKPTPTFGSPIYGQIVSAYERQCLVLELWPFDFPLSAKQASPVRPTHKLWRPRVSGFMAGSFGLSGVERVPAGKKWRWVAQRWLCEPTTHADILRALETEKSLRPRAIPSIYSEPSK